jgi:5' nucleotidase, deoxy (Pyrimidine), cytosolic type C protein (NT5C)
MTRQLFLDCDGVLADFEAGATEVLGMSPRAFEQRHGIREFWRRLARAPDFYARLPLMPDARILFDAVAHLDPIILTGLPLGNWAAPQKVRWAAEHFPGTRIITCMARDKYRHMKGKDVLVDDRADHREKWKAAGGTFVHHKSARESLEQLAAIYPTVKVPA